MITWSPDALDLFLRRQHRVGRAPGLGASGGQREALRQAFHQLACQAQAIGVDAAGIESRRVRG